MEKELANWIYYEEYEFYCLECVGKRLDEINKNKEFADEINYDGGDECGFMQDYADLEEEVECCVCGKPLYSKADL